LHIIFFVTLVAFRQCLDDQLAQAGAFHRGRFASNRDSTGAPSEHDAVNFFVNKLVNAVLS
jgi:hypothetical protein